MVIDEVGYRRLTPDQGYALFELVTARYEKGAIILTSNTSFPEWGRLLGNEVLASALLDRLLHHAEGNQHSGAELSHEGAGRNPAASFRRISKRTTIIQGVVNSRSASFVFYLGIDIRQMPFDAGHLSRPDAI